MADQILSANEATQNDKPDPRVLMAAERTLLAWIRTGLALMGFGFVVARFGFFLRELASVRQLPTLQHPGLSQLAGTSLVLLGVAVTALAGLRHGRFVYRYQRGQLLLPGVVSLGTVLAGILALLGIAMAVYLVLLR